MIRHAARARSARHACCLTFGLVIFVLAIHVGVEPANAQTEPPQAPRLSGESQESVDAPEAAVELTLYAFFATWCVPCRVELPHIDRIADTYRDRGLEVVLVSVDGPSTASEVPTFLERLGVDERWVLDADSELLSRYHPAASVPFTALVDAEGKMIYGHVGYEPGDEVELEEAILDAIRAREAMVEADVDEISTAFSLSSQSLGIWRTDRFDPVDDGRLIAGVERLELGAGQGPIWASARIDGSLIHDLNVEQPVEPDHERTATDARLERAALAVDLDALIESARLLAGDTYAQLGHGVLLSVRRVDPLGLDTALRGGRADLNTEHVYARIVGGRVNPQNLDPIELRIIDDEEDEDDWLVGAEAGYRIADVLRIGPELLLARARDAATDGSDLEWLMLGGSASLDLKAADIAPLRLAFEGASGEREGFGLDESTPWAFFGSTSVDIGPVTVLGEVKAYRHWQIGLEEDNVLYHEPPTLERDDQQVPGNEDAIGARGRVTWRILEGLSVFANWLSYDYTLDGTDPTGEDVYTAHHGYAGGEWRPLDGLSLAVAGGYRDESKPAGEPRLDLWHLDLDVAWRALPGLALTAKLNHVSETKELFSGPDDFVRGLAVVGASIPGWGALSILYGYSTEVEFRPTHYPAAELKAVLPLGGEARIFAGRLAGGRVCVSGSCRDVPPFEGARLDLILRY